MRSTMTLCLRPLAALVFVLAMAVPALAAEPGSPQGFLEAIYRTYEGKESKGFPLDKPAVIRRTFVPGLTNTMIKDIRSSHQTRRHAELDRRSLHRQAGQGDHGWSPHPRDRSTVHPPQHRDINDDRDTITHGLHQATAGSRIPDIKMNERTLRSLYPAKK